MVPPPTNAAIVASAGYSLKTAAGTAGRQMGLPGVKESLEELGFHEDAAKEVVRQILHKGKVEKNRLTAADMIFKVQGTYAAQKTVNTNVNVEVPLEEMDELRRRYEEELRARLESHVGTDQPPSLD